MSVRKLIQPMCQTLSPDQSIADAARAMLRDDRSAMLVVEGGDIVGIVTERDVVRRVVAMGRDVETTKIADAMTRNLICVYAEDSMELADGRMRERNVRHLAVTDPEHGPVGIIDATHLLRWRVESLADGVRSLESYLGADCPGG